MRWSLFAVLAAACAPLAPPRAVVSVVQPGAQVHNAVLALPTTCTTSEGALCDMAVYYQGTPGVRPANGWDGLVDPIVRLKLELAGYTLVDARSLKLSTVDRTDTSTASEAQGVPAPASTITEVGTTPTVADLSPADRAAAATSIGLAGELSSTLRVRRDGYRIRFELVLELHALDGDLLWTARCSDLEEDPVGTARLIAGCVGDAVVAWRAPDAVIGAAP